jgi:PAS domain S-box-containing protein
MASFGWGDVKELESKFPAWAGPGPPPVAFLAAIIQYVAHPIFIKNRRFEFVLFNRAFETMVGISAPELLGKSDYDFFPKEQADFFRGKDIEMFSSAATVVIEEEPLTDANGSRYVLSTTKVPYRDASGEVTHLFGIISDITDIKAAQDTLRTANSELERRVAERTAELATAQQELLRKERLAVLGHLAGGVAHQLRNPLAALQNAAALLRHGALDRDQTSALRIIDEEVARANRTITALLDYARVRPPSRRRALMTDIIEELLDAEDVPESVQVELDLTDVEAVLDVAQIQIALGNILRNALEAMPEGGVLKVGIYRGEGCVEVHIVDSGSGVDAEIEPQLFEPLVTTKADGSGLGLSTARNLIENQGGTIRYDSADGAGARFVVTLPDEPGSLHRAT